VQLARRGASTQRQIRSRPRVQKRASQSGSRHARCGRRGGAGRGVSSWRVCGRRACRTSCGPCGDAGNDPCSRQGDRVVASGSTGGRLLVEDDHGSSGEAPILSSRIAWRRPSAARRPLTGRACPDGRPGRGGVPSATLRTIKRRSTAAAAARSLSPAVAVVGTPPDGALACRPERASGRRRRRRPFVARSGRTNHAQLRCVYLCRTGTITSACQTRISEVR
jgi:hypothetical protein